MPITRLAFVFGTALLISAKAGLAQTPQTRLWDASVAGDTAAIRAAVKEGAKVDSIDFRASRNGRLPLNYAAYYNKPDAAKVLIELKAPIEATNVTGFTPLHHAAEGGSPEVARILIKAGAKLDTATAQGITAVDIARMKGNNAVADLIEAAMRDAKKQ